MDFDRIFSVFSKRDALSQKNNIVLTPEFKVRVYLLWTKTFPKGSPRDWVPSGSPLWSDVYDKLLYSLGQMRLSNRAASSTQADLDNFLGECSDEHFLDFIEFSFQSEAVFYIDTPVGNFIASVNQFFQEDDLPFFLTDFTYSQSGRMRTLESYPQIIRRDSETLHQTAIEPVLTLLKGQAFSSANREFLNALQDYRRGEYGDCVAKCGSALESVMKVISEHKGWPVHREVSKLLGTIQAKLDMPQFLRQPLIQTAVIRNELGSAHGAGSKTREVSEHLSEYTINVTAAAMLFIAKQADQ